MKSFVGDIGNSSPPSGAYKRQGDNTSVYVTDMMLHNILLLITATGLIQAIPRQDRRIEAPPEPTIFIVDRIPDNQGSSQQQKEDKVSARQQTPRRFEPNSQLGGFPFLESQFQYPGFNQQNFPRVQPSIYIYSPQGQGQPILFNPGSPPDNFLIPHQPQPGPNVILRGRPQQTPFFVGGPPNPKPAHIPPIEKDAEEIPTNPAKIPPFGSTPTTRKPEKLETFDESKGDYPFKTAGEADVLEAADKNPQFINGNALKPGYRFFVLNGDNLFQNIPNFPNYPEGSDVGLKYVGQFNTQSQYQQPQSLQKEPVSNDFNNIPIQTLILKTPVSGQISNANPYPEQEQRFNPLLEQQRYSFPSDQQRFSFPSDQQFLQNPNQLNQQTNVQNELFRSGFQPIRSDDVDPVGQFRFTAPNNPYYPIEGEDIENDSIIVDANFEDESKGGLRAGETTTDSQTEAGSRPDKSPEPSTAQAAPGAVALAGPGGVAGASPRATSIVGKGGVAVSNPQATAVAGTRKEEGKKEKDEKPQRKYNY
ncbi:hypothetical protein JTB14_024016 [Gonioctena quinquepunctata]|nr:hypothetical protein JTB14_024016 [Gonioctena quinquepunctata]